MRPLASLSSAEARQLRGVLFDLDDTLLTHGVLTLEAYSALWKLRDASLRLVGVTGRPSGWGEVLARQWPIDGCVVENGALYLVREGAGIARRDPCDEAERRARRTRLARLVERVRDVVPEARLTDDCDARRSDVTWDIGERAKLAEDRVRLIESEIVGAGARSTQSSVHLHATFDADDKATGALRFCARELGEDSTRACLRFAFIGDSGNDAACFSTFRTTIGVANVRASLARFTLPPRFVTEGAMGRGFAEMAAELVRKRSGSA